MQANLTQYEDVAELEDDILCFLPTVSDLDVFGCKLDLLDLHTQQPLPEAFRTALLQRPQLQIVVRLCMVEGHSIWQFQEDGRESFPKAVRVPANPRGEIADRAFYAAPVLPHVEVAMGIQHVGVAAWQSCQLLQIVKLSPSVTSLAEGTFQRCYVLREVAASGCVQCSRRVFAECCSLGRVGVSHETEDSNTPAPGALDTRLSRNAVPYNGCMHLMGLQINSMTKPSSGNASFKGASTLLRSLCVRFHSPEGQHCKLGPMSWHRAVLALRESLHSLFQSILLLLERMRVTVAVCLRVQTFATPLLKKFRNSPFFSTSTDAVWAWCPGHR